MSEIKVDGEVLGHLLILQHKQGGTISDVIRRLIDKAEPQLKLPLEEPRLTRRQPRRYIRKSDRPQYGD